MKNMAVWLGLLVAALVPKVDLHAWTVCDSENWNSVTTPFPWTATAQVNNWKMVAGSATINFNGALGTNAVGNSSGYNTRLETCSPSVTGSVKVDASVFMGNTTTVKTFKINGNSALSSCIMVTITAATGTISIARLFMGPGSPASVSFTTGNTLTGAWNLTIDHSGGTVSVLQNGVTLASGSDGGSMGGGGYVGFTSPGTNDYYVGTITVSK
jgi:hypothetical protein